MTRFLGTCQLIVNSLQLSPELTSWIPEQKKVYVHAVLGFAAMVIWAVQTQYNQDGSRQTMAYTAPKQNGKP